MSVLPVGIGSEEGGYQIERSLRFNSADSAYLNRTPASAGNRKTWTWSGWVKRSGSGGSMFAAYTSGSNRLRITFDSDKIQLFGEVSGSSVEATTTAVYRDYSAWYHIVVALDTTQATNTNRIKVYVNGVQVTSFSATTYPSQNADLEINNNSGHYIGQRGDSADYFNGYLTEVHFIDGSALTPTSFGEFNSDTGVWQPIKYTGTYGTNGFYLNFSDNASTTTLGDDFSGNSNDWTTNNFSVTAGAGNDSLVDSPTRYGTDTGAGGEVRGNYATLNPLDKGSAANPVSQNGNLDLVGADSSFDGIRSTFGITSSKWYWEVTIAAEGNETRTGPGIYAPTNNLAGDYGNGTLVVFDFGGTTYISDETGGSSSIYFSVAGTISAGDIFGFAFDADSGKVWVSKNGSYYNSGVPASGTGQVATLTTGITYFPGGWAFNSSDKLEFNFGQRAYSYTAPSGFKALVTTNLPEPTIADGGEYFNTVLYTGNGSTQSITGVGFQPDFTWIKSRSNATYNNLFDVVRGPTKVLFSNDTLAEVTNRLDNLTSFDSDGFSVGADVDVNGSARTMVAWNWKANGAGVSNTDGTITSTVSVNTTSGFSIVTYTGTGANATVGHGIGVAPSMVIVKSRDSSTEPWWVYHASIGAGGQLRLNGTNAAGTDGAVLWNSTAPTSSVFSVGTNTGTNGSGDDLVAYCFAPLSGFSLMSSYVGNGSADGVFVYTGFRPRWIMIKNSGGGATSSLQGWILLDTSRSPYNQTADALFANNSNASSSNSIYGMDILSNGFKTRGTDGAINESSALYVYMAFAENPFSIALAR